MKSSDSLLVELGSRGLTLTAKGGRLIVRPAGLLTDELRQAIRENRVGLLTLVASERSDLADTCQHAIHAEKSEQRVATARALESVRCCSCRNFLPMPQDIGDSEFGLGRCGLTHGGLTPESSACWPKAIRKCFHFNPAKENLPQGGESDENLSS